MPRLKKPIDERIKQTRNEILSTENRLNKLNELLKEQLMEKEELEKQNLYNLIKKHNLNYEDIEKLITCLL